MSQREQDPPFPVFGDQLSQHPSNTKQVCLETSNAKCVWRPPMPRPESPTRLFSQSQGRHVSETARKVVELEMNNYET